MLVGALGSAAQSLNAKNAETVKSLFGDGSILPGGNTDPSAVFDRQGSDARQALQLAAGGIKREIDRLGGFKTDIQPAQKKRLADLQAQISAIDAKASDGSLDPNDLERRAERLQEAFRILGKDFVNIEDNPELQALNEKVDKLLEPELRGAPLKRLEALRKLEESTLDAIERNPKNETNRTLLRNIKKQISQLLPPRQISKLSVEERRQYDDLVEQVNALAGTEFLLGSKKRIRIATLQTSLNQIQAQIDATAAPEAPPTAAQVIRAYRG